MLRHQVAVGVARRLPAAHGRGQLRISGQSGGIFFFPFFFCASRSAVVICPDAFLLCVDELRRLLERRCKTAETGTERVFRWRTVTHCFCCTQTYAALPKAAARTPPGTKTSSFLGRLPLYSSISAIHHLLRGQASIAAQRRLTGRLFDSVLFAEAFVEYSSTLRSRTCRPQGTNERRRRRRTATGDIPAQDGALGG
jgi:hypothetical protein